MVDDVSSLLGDLVVVALVGEEEAARARAHRDRHLGNHSYMTSAKGRDVPKADDSTDKLHECDIDKRGRR